MSPGCLWADVGQKEAGNFVFEKGGKFEGKMVIKGKCLWRREERHLFCLFLPLDATLNQMEFLTKNWNKKTEWAKSNQAFLTFPEMKIIVVP
jgi:hypothetical protein